ncbi:MAG TPA: Rieske 2Fe-2S domain-containing protein, partial [Thermomicrobiales bacterium]|nr:Rieske 2Fe-2S domain-containing protein [Thermomicrobiales bacterium]
KDALYGVWLGHPLHPAVVTMPIGFWTTTMMLDAIGEEKASDLSLKLGFVSALGAATTGAAQWQDTYNQEAPRRLGTLHALLNVVATTLYGASWVARSNGSRGAGVALSTAGFGLVNVSAWLGGDLAYDLGIGVNRTAFEQQPSKWTDVLAESELPENSPKRVEADGVPVLLLKRDGEIFAISAVCTHLGGPLEKGEIDGETVTCPWHGSVFCLRDGKVIHGPATVSEPAYEVRVQGGRVAVRLSA